MMITAGVVAVNPARLVRPPVPLGAPGSYTPFALRVMLVK
jgi:hypothetical protein